MRERREERERGRDNKISYFPMYFRHTSESSFKEAHARKPRAGDIGE